MKKIFLVFLLLASQWSIAQDDVMQRMADSLDFLDKPTHEFTSASFKATRVINFPTMETMGKNAMDFRIAHRFGEFANGNGNPAYNAFGLDGDACIRLSLDYGITDWLMVGIGRTSDEKLADASFKIKMLRQTTDNHIPISVTVQSAMNYTFLKDPNNAFTGIDKYKYPVNRISYATCLIIGRKINQRLTLELNEFYIHYNIVDFASDKNDIFATGISGRYKISKRFAVTFEYAHRIGNYISKKETFHDPLGIGFDLETGGHVFQFHFTNQFGMNEVQYIPYTKSDWLKGNIRLGFNISRVFAIKHKNKSTT